MTIFIKLARLDSRWSDFTIAGIAEFSGRLGGDMGGYDSGCSIVGKA
jgi:hypothetical protein